MSELKLRPLRCVYEMTLVFRFLRHDVNIDRGGFPQETVHGGKIEIFSPIVNGSAAENYLGNMFGAHELGDGIGDAASTQTNDFCSEIFSELQIGGQGSLIRFLGTNLPVDVDDIELGIHAPRHAGATRDQILPRGIRRNANGHALADTPVLADVLILHVGFEAAIDLLGNLAQG